MIEKTLRPQPLQNKVDPWGQLHALRFRGSLMGNRGILHDGQKIVRQWVTKSWVACSLDATFQKRSPFTQGTYSELFFLDEATAYSAGHRPCRTCRRDKHDQFNLAWTAANRSDLTSSGKERLSIADIDAALHAERVGPDKQKRTHPARLGDLPVGTLFSVGGKALLVGPVGLREWSFDGYHPTAAVSPDAQVALLTPPSVVAAIRYGLQVDVHPSATA